MAIGLHDAGGHTGDSGHGGDGGHGDGSSGGDGAPAEMAAAVLEEAVAAAVGAVAVRLHANDSLSPPRR